MSENNLLSIALDNIKKEYEKNQIKKEILNEIKNDIRSMVQNDMQELMSKQEIIHDDIRACIKKIDDKLVNYEFNIETFLD